MRVQNLINSNGNYNANQFVIYQIGMDIAWQKSGIPLSLILEFPFRNKKSFTFHILVMILAGSQ